jgi:hypothetical protein
MRATRLLAIEQPPEPYDGRAILALEKKGPLYLITAVWEDVDEAELKAIAERMKLAPEITR